MIFRRRRERAEDEPRADAVDDSADEETLDEDLEDLDDAEDVDEAELDEDVVTEDEGNTGQDTGRRDGPWDVHEDFPEMERLDLGAVKLPVDDELGVQVGMEEDQVVVATVMYGESALELMAFAAPKSRGIWDDVRSEMIKSLKESGGSAVAIDGAFGRELMAEVPVVSPKGQQGTQPVRFVGVDGPRWFLRGAFAGRAAGEAKEATPLEKVFRGIVVDRGSEAMAPQERIPMDLPKETREALGLIHEEEGTENRFKGVRRSPAS